MKTGALGAGGTFVHNLLSLEVEPREIAPKGIGSFAVRPLLKGSHVATFGGPILARQQFEQLPADVRSRSIQIELEVFVAGPPLREDGDSVNHSCEPNCGLRNATQLVAMRDIEAHEELTYDYAISDASDYDEFECGCATTTCRGRILQHDWTRLELQKRYEGYFSPYIARLIAASAHKRVLTKREVETMVNDYDNEPLGALTIALRIATGFTSESFGDLMKRTGLFGAPGYSPAKTPQLEDLDAILKVLIEQRTVGS